MTLPFNVFRHVDSPSTGPGQERVRGVLRPVVAAVPGSVLVAEAGRTAREWTPPLRRKEVEATLELAQVLLNPKFDHLGAVTDCAEVTVDPLHH